jgi:hypothetical protein
MLRNHASDRRDYHLAPNLKTKNLLVRTAEMVAPAS